MPTRYHPAALAAMGCCPLLPTNSFGELELGDHTFRGLTDRISPPSATDTHVGLRAPVNSECFDVSDG